MLTSVRVGTIAFFALMLAYVRGCSALGRDRTKAERRHRHDRRKLDRRHSSPSRCSSTWSTPCSAPRSSEARALMTLNGWLQILVLLRSACCSSQSRSASTSCACTTARSRWLGAGRAADLPRLRRRSETRTSTGRATPAACCSSASRRCCSRTSCCACSTCCRSTRSISRAVPDRQAFETAASFTTNTNWQSYSGEAMMSYFSQMTQLAFHNFVSAAVGMAVAVALVRGIARRVGGPARQLLGRPRARHALRAAAALAHRRAAVRAAGRDPELQAVPRRSRRSRARSRRSRWARWRARRRSSSSARTAAASSTPTPRIRSRTRRRGPTSGRCSRSS